MVGQFQDKYTLALADAKKKREDEYSGGIMAKLKLLNKKQGSITGANSWMLIQSQSKNKIKDIFSQAQNSALLKKKNFDYGHGHNERVERVRQNSVAPPIPGFNMEPFFDSEPKDNKNNTSLNNEVNGVSPIAFPNKKTSDNIDDMIGMSPAEPKHKLKKSFKEKFDDQRRGSE